MNNNIAYILIISCLATLGCQQQEGNIDLENKPESFKGIEGLVDLSEQWTQDSTSYWTRDKDSTRQELQPSDTISTANYTLTKKYRNTLRNDLTVRKLIDIDPKTKRKISETDIYIKRLNSSIESRLWLKYSYDTERYYAQLLIQPQQVKK